MIALAAGSSDGVVNHVNPDRIGIVYQSPTFGGISHVEGYMLLAWTG